MKSRLAMVAAASIFALVGCGSRATSYRDFKEHTEAAQTAAGEAGFGPGWDAQQAQGYAATEVEWLNAHPPEGCYALLHADLRSVFQARANGEFKAPLPPSLVQHLQAAETAC